MDDEQAWAVTRVRLADRFGWAFEYIENLTHDDLIVINAVDEADKLLRPEPKSKNELDMPRPD